MKPDENGNFLVGIEDIAQEWMPGDRVWDYDRAKEASLRDFEEFLATMPEVPEKYKESGRLAAYIDWSCIVKKQGFLTRDSMLMAKNWMCDVWSWDHCFNAIALSYHNPAAAWDQFMLMFDYQHESGCLPDSVSDAYALWAAVKPPIHGWALGKMMQNMLLTPEQCKEAYTRLSKWTQWWLNWRDEDEDGICEYQDGCDSGWDNSTAFRDHSVVETPDLPAYLILQMELLGKLADKLNYAEESEAWKEQADAMFRKYLAHSFENGRSKSVFSGTHEIIESESLILYLPLLLGKRLPEEIRGNMIADLKSDRFLTVNGLATESVSSVMYHPDGYWRGPIWAPSTMLLVDGLNNCGETEFAREISRRFCDMAAKSGFAENYDALTGEGLRDRAYTWTSSVFLILAKEYLL